MFSTLYDLSSFGCGTDIMATSGIFFLYYFFSFFCFEIDKKFTSGVLSSSVCITWHISLSTLLLLHCTWAYLVCICELCPVPVDRRGWGRKATNRLIIELRGDRKKQQEQVECDDDNKCCKPTMIMTIEKIKKK